MAANVFYLTMQFYYFYAFLAFALAAPLVFRPSRRGEGPRPDDVVPALGGRRRRRLRRGRGRGPARRGRRGGASSRRPTSATSAIAYGGGIVQNLRAKPWLVAAVPLFLAALRARRAARGARRRRRARALDPVGARGARDAASRSCSRCGARTSSSRGARRGSRGRSCAARGVVIAASSFLAREAAALGARDVRVIPSGVEIPAEVGEPDEPPHVLFVGRLSEEKGILDFLEATEGLPRVIVGDGPLRDRVPGGGRLRPAGRARRRTTSAPRSCASRRGARATAWSRARRWPTAGPSSRRGSAGWWTRSRTA